MVVSRIAPTPSGYLHAGNAYSFVLTWLITKLYKGKLCLRIDDLDAARKRREYIEDIFATLEFLGISYDFGPNDAEEFENTYSQSLRLSTYTALLDNLIASGRVFACSCSRAEISEMPGAIYNGKCRDLNLSFDLPNAALRLDTSNLEPVHLQDELLGKIAVDVHQETPYTIVRRKDGIPAYQVASLADDLAWKINCIVRGQDLLTSTAIQLAIANICNASDFLTSRFFHHPLIKDTSGSKLSKSQKAASIRSLYPTPSHFYAWISSLWGIQPACSRIDDLPVHIIENPQIIHGENI